MKKKLFLMIFIILLSISILNTCAKNKSRKIVLKAADGHGWTYPTTMGLIRMGALLEEWTYGRISLKIYPQAQLGSEKETIEQTQLGAIDIDRVNIIPITQVVKEMKVLALPYIFRNEEHEWKVLNGEVGEELLKGLENYELIGLGYYDSGQRSFYNTKRAIRNIGDLEDLRIRVQKADIVFDAVRAVGAIPIQMAFEEVYAGLQTGLIDGAENNEPSYITKGHYESAKYYSYDEHSRVPEIIIMSKKRWDKLSPKDRELIVRAAKESIPYQRELWKKEVERAVAKAKARGCVFITKIDKEPFIKAMEPVYEKYAPDLHEWIKKIRDVK